MEQESGHQSESIDFCGHVGSLRGLLGVGWVTMVAEMGNGVQKHRQADAYRAEDHWDRQPGLAADLGRRQVVAITTPGGAQPARVARAAAPTIPIVFLSGSDPVQNRLVRNLNRPGGNTTGVSVLYWAGCFRSPP